MNYLAHALLSGPSPQWVLGGFLGDHVRGSDWQTYPSAVAAGILLHRRIDSFVDSHTVFGRARSRLGPGFRRYGGILLDMYFDHLLALQWDRHSDRPLAEFALDQYRLLRQHRSGLPETLRRFADHMEANDLLVAYRDRDAVERALAGVGRRLRRDNPLHRGMQEMDRIAEELAADFEELWPAVADHAGRQREQLAEIDHQRVVIGAAERIGGE